MSILSTAERVLLESVRTHPDLESVRARVQSADFDWDALILEARRNRVTAFTSKLLEDARPTDARIGTRLSELRGLGEEASERAFAARAQVDEIGAALARVGVTPLLYKGPDFQDRCYELERPRSFGDIDIIVREGEVARAAEVLTDEGYRQPPGAPSLDYYRRFHLHAIYLQPPRLPVELHWALDSPYAGDLDVVPKLYADARADEAFARNVLRPSLLDALVLMASHLDKHLGICASLGIEDARLKALLDERGLIWVLDILRWMERYAESYTPADVLARARELGEEQALVVSLRLALDVRPGGLPPWAREQAERLPHGRPLLSRVVFPDLGAGRAPSRFGNGVRSFLDRALPGVGFRPMRLVEFLLPKFRVPFVEQPKAARSGLLTRLRLGVSNVFAIAAWRFGEWRRPDYSTSDASE